MTIIKHGKKWVEYKMECPECGCIFLMNKDELHERISESMFSYRLKDIFIVNCPECLHPIMKKNEV